VAYFVQVEEALEILSGVPSGRPALAKATALRRKGVVHRDMGDYEDSVDALMVREPVSCAR
jgi:hypothetical protein